YIATPTISTVDPVAGPLDGTNTLTITGTHLDDTNLGSITIDENACTQITVNSPTEVTCTAPSGTVGAKNIVLTNPGGTVTKTSAYTYTAAPDVVSITPVAGPAAGGNDVSVNGTVLIGATAVTIGGVDCPIVSNSGTVIVCTAGIGSVGAQNVTVTTPGGSETETGLYTYADVPSISSLNATSGPAIGTGTLIVTGSNLTDATGITIGGNACTGLTDVSATSATCTIPAGTAGDQNVIITTPGGPSSPYTYTYIATPTISTVDPVAGPLDGTNTLTITGTHLDDTNLGSITIDENACTQ
ncbi:transporter, partial [Actinoplanes sp. ATCC 53533]